MKPRRIPRHATLRPSVVRTEGVIDMGVIHNVAFVRTEARLVIQPADRLNELRDIRTAKPRLRELRRLGLSIYEIAQMYDSDPDTISRITIEGGWKKKPALSESSGAGV